MQGVPYRPLSAMYFFYFASLGVFVPFWSMYLRDLGFDSVAIGELIAVTMATKVIAPIVWGYLADHSGQRLLWIRIGSGLAALVFAFASWLHGYWWMVVILALFSFFWNAILPLFESVTMNHLGDLRQRYSHIRLWGSVGFIISSLALGQWFAQSSISQLPWIMSVALLLIFISTWWVRESPQDERHEGTQGFWRQVFGTPVWLLMLAFFLMQLSHGPYYAFFSIYLSDHGYPQTAIGAYWAWGVVAEVFVFLVVHRWLARLGAARLLALALLITSVRWLMVAHLVDSAWWLWIAQTLHAASYGLFHASAIHLVHQWFPGRLQSRGQALYSSMSFGLGNAVGSWVSGYTWEGWSPVWTYTWASAAAMLGALLVWLGYAQLLKLYQSSSSASLGKH